jgi:protein-tyrosine phosphatase
MAGPLRILVVCTANRARSPMAEALLARRLPDAHVSSAGSLPAGHPATDGATKAMATRGIDIAAHRSRVLSPQVIADADLVVAMARRHVRDVVVLDPGSFRKTFTLKELVRRGEPAGAATDLDQWLNAVAAGRQRADVLGDDSRDDVADPIGMPDATYEETAATLEDLLDRLAVVLAPITG